MRFRRVVLLALTALLLGNLAGCEYLPFGYTPIGDIVANPAAYEGREVKVKGRVQDVTKVPFMETKFYTLAADGYQIPVLTDRTLPMVDSEVVVIGEVENIAIINNQSIGLHIREIKRVDKPLW